MRTNALGLSLVLIAVLPFFILWLLLGFWGAVLAVIGIGIAPIACSLLATFLVPLAAHWGGK